MCVCSDTNVIGKIIAGGCELEEVGCVEDTSGPDALALHSPLQLFKVGENFRSMTAPFSIATFTGITNHIFTCMYAGTCYTHQSLNELLTVAVISVTSKYTLDININNSASACGCKTRCPCSHFDIVNKTNRDEGYGEKVFSFDIIVDPAPGPYPVSPPDPGKAGRIVIQNLAVFDVDRYKGEAFVISLTGPSGPGYSEIAPIYNFEIKLLH
jgi:hypothetical protein